jgi:hypothetical protein
MKLFFLFTIMALSSINRGSAQKDVLLVEGPEGNYFSIKYSVEKENVKFTYYYGGYGNRYPSVKVDVNQNDMIDNMLDRSYGFTGSGLNIKSCSQYLIDEHSSTACGVASSGASVKGGLLRVDGNTNFKFFYIPKKELSTSGSADVIHVMFQIAEEKDGKWTYSNYPECSGIFEKVYEIKIK